ncbi:DUF3012 domain-containing protein [Aliiglaciecola sp. CAU 1673]|uniref:DUF3012 domain-containing protein n=1 Tax=Aliiglaciecola sp. CAU 1673 TaxID=3032595 RepID=UPI0023DCA903|nr:DUF3012 domain-containing protein [Aliiglaciecola sp. CAU 1673]MDF2176908.1 DUF3012 domain-containing protein [Aliiglaciecola sp. CAU 1673]
MKKIGLLLASAMLLAACAPEVGTKEWCEALKEKPKGEWTANEAKDFTKHCLFGNEKD